MAEPSYRRYIVLDRNDLEHGLVSQVAECHLGATADRVVRQPDGLRDVRLEDQTVVGDLAKITYRGAYVGTELLVGNPANDGVDDGRHQFRTPSFIDVTGRLGRSEAASRTSMVGNGLH